MKNLDKIFHKSAGTKPTLTFVKKKKPTLKFVPKGKDNISNINNLA